MMEKDSLIRPNAPSRNKKPARFYYVLMVLVFMVLFLDSVISLGSLGVVQQRLHNLSPVSKCILFGSRGIDYDNDVVIYLPNVGACAFVLWGQVSIVVVSFVWIVLYISQAVIAPRVISVMRMLDFLMMGLFFLLSFSLSITVTAGLSKTCDAILNYYTDYSLCSLTYLRRHNDDSVKMYFYEGVHSAQSSLWVAAIMFLCLTVFYLILMIMFCIRVKNRRNEAIMSQFRHEDENVSQSSSSSEPEELGDVVEEKKTQPNPFTYT